MLWCDIFVNCKWVATRWQLYNTHLRTNSTQNDTKFENNTKITTQRKIVHQVGFIYKIMSNQFSSCGPSHAFTRCTAVQRASVAVTACSITDGCRYLPQARQKNAGVSTYIRPRSLFPDSFGFFIHQKSYYPALQAYSLRYRKWITKI